jgi:predicted dehydrogenase
MPALPHAAFNGQARQCVNQASAKEVSHPSDKGARIRAPLPVSVLRRIPLASERKHSVINIGIIGYGYWGPNLVRNFAETPGANVAAVSDLDTGKLAVVQRRFPAVKTTTDFRDLLNDPTIDAIAIATPVHTHFELALAALRAGKHVWVEKPMTETSQQARQLIDEAQRQRRVLLVDHTFIYTGAVAKMGELIRSGDLGKIYYYDSIRVNLGLFQRDVSVISDLAVHDFSILDFLLNEHPVAVTASGMNHFPGTPENLAYVTLFYESGTIAHANVSWLAPVKVRQILVGGSKKMITYDDLEPSEKIKVYDKGVSFTDNPEAIQEMRVGYRTGDMWAPKLAVTEALRVEGEHFVDCIVNSKVPRTDGQLGLRVVELIEAASQSMRRKGETVYIQTREKSS